MSNLSYCSPSNVPEIIDAIQRIGVATSNNVYDKISVFSTYWGSDDTGGDKDSSLFIETIQKLQNVDAHKYVLLQGHTDMKLARDVFNALPSGNPSRRLFIFHYAGHSIRGSAILVPKIDQKFGTGPEFNIERLKIDLKVEASTQVGLDVLFIVDSCCSSVNPGPGAKGARVEFIAASRHKDLTDKRTASDGRTFTQHWCATFNNLLDTGKPFVCEEINRNINPDSWRSPFPSLYIQREGWDLPITFSSHNNTIESSLPSDFTSQTIVTVFYLKENSDSPSLKQLIEYFKNAPVPITVLGIVPVSLGSSPPVMDEDDGSDTTIETGVESTISGTLVLISMPYHLQELLVGSRVAIELDDD